jgi:hypothetical protein
MAMVCEQLAAASHDDQQQALQQPLTPTRLSCCLQEAYSYLLACRRYKLMCCIPLAHQRLQQLKPVQQELAVALQAASDALRPKAEALATFAAVNHSTAQELAAAGVQELVSDARGQGSMLLTFMTPFI